MTELKIGSTLQGGKYEIIKVLGSGAFGITYLATTKIAVNGQLGQMDVTVNVAIKEFFMKDLNNRTSDGSIVEGTQNLMVKNYHQKFKKEAENLSKLHHPNIVRVIEVFDENNTTYYVMEYIEGGSLDDYIKSKGHLNEEDALKCTMTIADALSYMHNFRMIHLDLKPKNIMRNSKGTLYLIDFGLSKQYDENGEPESSTSIGLGTPGYAPIEQASYKQDGTLPVTLDIYALGASLYKMLTGKTPPESSFILNEGFPSSVLQQEGIKADVIHVVEKAMAPMKKDRYQTVDAMSKAISNIMAPNEGEKKNTEDKEDTIIDNKVVNQTIPIENEKEDKPNDKELTKKSPTLIEKYWKYGVAAIVILLGIFLLLNLIDSSSNSKNEATGHNHEYTVNNPVVDSIIEEPTNKVIAKTTAKSNSPKKDNEQKTFVGNTQPKSKGTNQTNSQASIPSSNNNHKESNRNTSQASTPSSNSGVSNNTIVTKTSETIDKSTTVKEEDNTVYYIVEENPSFPGGMTALYQYFSTNIKYPSEAEAEGTQGRVLVSFVVEKDGSITDITVVKSVDPLLDAEAKRVISKMPRWNPGKNKGAVVRVKYTIPVTFRLP